MGAVLKLAFGLFKFGKVGGAALTLLISLAVYAGIWGWRFAAGFLALLALHEFGHFVAARQRGLAVSLPTFIPFVGAWIELKDQPMSVETEAYVAMAGPLVGAVAATLVYAWGRGADSRVLLAIAYSGFFLNFINLLPLPPLDGGRITAILSPRVWLLGAPLMLALMLYSPSPLLVVITIVAVPSLMKALKYDPRSPENAAYYGVALATRLEYGALYLGLAAYLAVMTVSTQSMIGGLSPR